jgi:cytochrome P450
LLILLFKGPIIRINPTELHINDPDYYDSLYNREGRWDKNPFYAESFGNTGSGFTTVKHDLHRLRRAAINPFFSKQKVTALQPLIQELVDKLCARFEKIRGTDEVVPMECAFDAFTMDVITEYSLDTSFGYLDVPGWNSDFRELERAFGEMGYRQKIFPAFVTMLRGLPNRLVLLMNPNMALLQNFLENCGEIAERMLRETDSTKYQEKAHPTIFYEIIHSDLPPAEKTTKRLEAEAAAILGAGAVTTAWTLTTAMYHLVVQPEKLNRLRAEIRSVMPDPFQPATLQQLEQLPYLTSVIMESLRLSNGISTRLARVAPDRSLYFHDWVIPKGTAVGMTSVLIHQNSDIFPQPLEFIPERWLDAKEKQRMERYLVPFSKGTRGCLGIK